MTSSTTIVTLDPAALTAFVASLSSLPKEEVRKAKILYIRNAIVDFKASRSTGKAMVVIMGCLCIIPIFLIVFIPTLIAYRKGIESTKQKLLNAIEVWREDLGSDADFLEKEVRA